MLRSGFKPAQESRYAKDRDLPSPLWVGVQIDVTGLIRKLGGRKLLENRGIVCLLPQCISSVWYLEGAHSVCVSGTKESMGKVSAATSDSVDNPVLFLTSKISWARYLETSEL